MNIFIAFANQDRDVRDKLLRQMNLVKDRQGWNIWSSKEIKAGERWDDEIKQRLMASEVIVLLLSTDFFNSKYIIETELPKVVEKHRQGDCQIIPVIARVCHWKETAFGEYAELGDIQALPVGEKPITSKVHWGDEDQPYFEVVEGMKEAIRAFQAKKSGAAEAAQREREAQARREQEKVQRAENERLTQLRQEQEQAGLAALAAEAQRAKEARQAAWQQAADAHTVPAYEAYLLAHPQGEYAREARYRIKELKRREAAPVPWGRYAAIGGGVLAVALVLWWASEAVTSSHRLTPPSSLTSADSTQLSSTSTADSLKKDTVRPTEQVQAEKQAVPNPAPAAPSTFVFDYPMERVAGGTFQMGSPTSETGRSDNECQHSVAVGTFYMGKYEVTQAQWKAVMGKNPSGHINCDDCPVENVSWNDVQIFLKKLNSLTGKNYRLPIEAEWEYAAKGGAKSQHYTYAGGNTLGSVAWYIDNSGSATHPVGRKSPNELGLYDMSGNVWEWCQDSWKPYPCDTKTTADGRFRVGRGGSWYSFAPYCRAANRKNIEAAYRSSYVGVRLCSFSLQ